MVTGDDDDDDLSSLNFVWLVNWAKFRRSLVITSVKIVTADICKNVT
jgi:hypothetical protein